MTGTRAADVAARGLRHVEFEPLPAVPGEVDRPLIPMKTSGTALPVFMVHGGYGQVFQFKRLAERLRDDIPLYGLEARGLRDGGEPETSVPKIAASYLAAIRAERPQGPYLIAGFSFGGWVAWEMAQQLDEAGEDARLLVLDVGLVPLPGARVSRFRRIGRELNFHWQNWKGVRGKARRAYQREGLKAEVMRLSGFLGLERTGFLYRMATKLGPDEPAGQIRIFRASLRAMTSWEPPRYERPMTLFRAELQPPAAQNDERMNITPEFAAGGIDVHAIPGSHTFIYQEPHVNQLAVELEAWVDRQAAPSGLNDLRAPSGLTDLRVGGQELNDLRAPSGLTDLRVGEQGLDDLRAPSGLTDLRVGEQGLDDLRGSTTFGWADRGSPQGSRDWRSSGTAHTSYPARMTSPLSEPAHHFVEGDPRLHAVEWRAGAAPTLLLLHGATHHARYWDPLVRLLEPYRVIALDARGHGRSEWGERGHYDPDHYVADLERAIDQLVPDGRLALIGHSTGSLVSMRYAHRHPERLWAVSFIDIDPRPPASQATNLRAAGERPSRRFESLHEVRTRIARITPGLDAWHVDLLAETGFEQVEDGSYRPRMDQRTLAEFPQFDNRPLLPEITTPALVIRGNESTVSSAAAAEAAAEALPNGELASVPGEHQLHAQRPDEVASALSSFLEGAFGSS